MCPTPQVDQRSWFALYVKSRHEKSVGATVRQWGCESFVPLYKASNRSRVVDLPLFPNYVFCRLDLASAPPLVRIPGVFEIVKQGRNPAEVCEEEVTAIQTIVSSGYPARPWPNLRIGDTVKIDAGPFRGIVGTIDRTSNQLVVSIALLQRSIAVTLPREWVIPGEQAESSSYVTRQKKAMRDGQRDV
jgi:transcription termination/antitermination protein NusG